MKFSRHLIAIITIILVTTGCTAKKTEDVRFKLCKEVTARLLDSMKPVTFKSQQSEIRNIGDAAIRLSFTINRKGYENKLVTSACFFDYEINEQTVIDHVDPLSAYSTLPYKMTIQGQEVPQEILSQAVTAEQIEPVFEYLERVRQAMDNIPDRIK